MTDADIGYSGTLHWFGEYERGDPRELYSLFRRPPDDARKGHLAMRGLIEPGDELYAKPYGDKGVELRLLPSGPGAQLAAVNTDGLVVSHWHEQSELLVFGLVADHVAAVEVDVGGETFPARLENNAYAVLVVAQRDDSGMAPFGFVLYRADGTAFRI